MFARLDLIATAQSYGFGAEQEMTAMLSPLKPKPCWSGAGRTGWRPCNMERPCVPLFPTAG